MPSWCVDRELHVIGFLRNSLLHIRDSSVDIATCYGLYGPWIKSRWGARIYATIQTGPGVHTASYTIGTRTFPGGKWPGVELNTHPLLAPR